MVTEMPFNDNVSVANYPANFMELSSSWEATNFAATEELHSILWNTDN
jgi:hypothetical protein